MKTKIVSVIMAYKRNDNLLKVVDGIRRQTIPSKIIIFNNGDYELKGIGADIIINSNFNFNCLPRFFVGGWIDSDFVWQNDDDHAIKDSWLFEKLIIESEEYPEFALCWNGRKLANTEKAYQEGEEVTSPISCSVCNYGFSFYPSHIMKLVPPHPFAEKNITFDEMKFADDIWISCYLKNRVSAHIRGALESLPEGLEQITLSKSSQHMDARNAVAKRLIL